MALKPDRNITDGEDISYFLNHVAERGGVVVFNTAGSGAAMDDGNATVAFTGSHTASGTNPAGFLMNDMVNLDLTRQHINWHKDEIQLGGKVAVARRGTITTNVIDNSATPNVGNPAYYTSAPFTGADGSVYTNAYQLTTINPGSTGAAPANTAGSIGTPDVLSNRVGTFLSQKDVDGYAKVQINIL